MEKAYCESCDRKVPYSIHSIDKKETVNGVSFYYREDCVMCNICSSDITINKISDKNEKRKQKSYENALKFS